VIKRVNQCSSIVHIISLRSSEIRRYLGSLFAAISSAEGGRKEPLKAGLATSCRVDMMESPRTTLDQLKCVFEACQPNEDGCIREVVTQLFFSIPVRNLN
jgi:hypothetical protein